MKAESLRREPPRDGFPDRLAAFRDLTAGIQSIALVVAAIVGGIWTYQTFGGFEQVASLLDISLAAAQVDDPETKTPYLRVVANIVNHGKRVEEITVPQGPLRVFWIDPKASRTPPLRPDAKEGPGWHIRTNFETSADVLTSEDIKQLSKPPKILLLPGVTKVFAFLVPVSGPGMYYVTLTLPRQGGAKTAWTSGTFVAVNPPTALQAKHSSSAAGDSP
jgi:hypothetical protein